MTLITIFLKIFMLEVLTLFRDWFFALVMPRHEIIIYIVQCAFKATQIKLIISLPPFALF